MSKSDSSSRFRVYLHLATLEDLPEDSSWPGFQGLDALHFLRESGFEGVQNGMPKLCQEAGLGCFASGRIDLPEEALPLAKKLHSEGYDGVTLHVGTDFMNDPEMDALGRAVVDASGEIGFPMFIETHRATITQDIWRTLQWIQRVPEVRLNGDFSHYYTGHEFPYGDVEEKMDQMEPIFERVRFMHGRIGNSSCMQVDIGDGKNVRQSFGVSPFLDHYRELWTRAMTGFLKAAEEHEILILAPEILAPRLYYGRVFFDSEGNPQEEADRFAQALVYARIARECFAEAQRRVSLL